MFGFPGALVQVDIKAVNTIIDNFNAPAASKPGQTVEIKSITAIGRNRRAKATLVECGTY